MTTRPATRLPLAAASVFPSVRGWPSWAVIILALLGTVHILVNYFDLFEFVQKLHGG